MPSTLRSRGPAIFSTLAAGLLGAVALLPAEGRAQSSSTNTVASTSRRCGCR